MIPERVADRMCPVYQQLLMSSSNSGDAETSLTLEQLRANYKKQVRSYDVTTESSIETHDLFMVGRNDNAIALRLFQQNLSDASAPAVLYIHGGGWVLGDIDSHAGICADIAMHTGFRVVSVDYRLSPESIYPSALHDCIDALHYIVDSAQSLCIDPRRVSLMGDSAGGNLCAAVAMACRQRSITIASQVLLYPSLGADTSLPSFFENEDIPGLSRDDMQYYFQTYIGGETLPDALAAPLTATHFDQLPPSYISVAEFDPLRDDGCQYAKNLSAAATPTTLSVEQGLGHSWLWVRNHSTAAQLAFRRACRFLLHSDD